MRIVPADKVRPVVTGRHVGPRTAPVAWKEKTTEWKAKIITLAPNSMSQVAEDKKFVKMPCDDDEDNGEPTDEAKTPEKRLTEPEPSQIDKLEMGKGGLGVGVKGRKDMEMVVGKSLSESKRGRKKRGMNAWLVKKIKLKS